MAIFGLGYSGVRRPLETVLVIPADAGLSQDAQQYQDLAGVGLHVQRSRRTPAAAEAALQAQQIDLVVVAPRDLEQQFRAGKRAVVTVEYNTVDPVEANYAGFLAERLSAEVNRAIIDARA